MHKHRAWGQDGCPDLRWVWPSAKPSATRENTLPSGPKIGRSPSASCRDGEWRSSEVNIFAALAESAESQATAGEELAHCLVTHASNARMRRLFTVLLLAGAMIGPTATDPLPADDAIR